MHRTDISPKYAEKLGKCTAGIPRTLDEKVAPEHTAIVVVDMQNEFCHSESVWVQRGIDVSSVQEMTPKLVKFLAEARSYQPLIIFVRTVYTEWSISPVSMEQQLKFPEHLRCFPRDDTWGAEFYQVAPQNGDCIVTKYRYSAFQGTDLELILHSNGIKTLIVTGVATPVCVESTARDGYMKEFFIVITEDCVTARTAEEQRSSLSIMDRFFGTVVSSEEIIAAWKRQKTSRKA